MTVVYTILTVSAIIAFIGLFMLSENESAGTTLVVVGGIPLVITTIMAMTVAMYDDTTGFFIKRETVDMYNERCNNDWREGDLNKVVCADGTVVELKKLSPEKDTTNVK